MTEVIHHRVSHFDYDDDEPDALDILGEPEVRLDETFSNVIVVDHVPVTSEDRFAKLTAVIKKVFGQIGTIVEDGLYIPIDEETKQTKGFAFVEFTTKEAADTAVQQLDGFKLDKAHVFKVIHFDDFKRYESVPETYEAPETRAYSTKDNLQSWLVDEKSLRGLDQFVVRQGDNTEIYWNSGLEPQGDQREQTQNKPIESRPGWTESYVTWSPLGTYLATFHRQGIQLWGGEKFTKQVRFMHLGARLAEFSPCENYLVTFSPQFAENDDPKDPKCVIVWNVRTGEKMRGFTSPQNPPWPLLQWSHDDKFFARLGEDIISVYETPSMGLLEKQSLKTPGVKDFCWSPGQNVISYFVPEKNNVPAKVVLLSIPARKELRQKNLFNVSDCKLHWQSEGKYLCVKVDRQKSKKTTVVNFELFRAKEKDVPIESLEIPDSVHAFAWEPKGDRFAIIHGENANRPDVSFYTLIDEKKKKNLKKLHTLEKKAANSLFWSPAGNYIVLAGLRNLNGVLEFFSVGDKETLANEEHNMCTNIEWDPSGRFVATQVSHWRHQLDTGYHMYTFAGKLLTKVVRDKFFQLLWRPRPPTMLTDAMKKDLKAKYSEKAEKYREEENKGKIEADLAAQRERDAIRKAFNDLMQEREKEYAAWRKELSRLTRRNYEAEEKELEEIEKVNEELLHYEEVVV